MLRATRRDLSLYLAEAIFDVIHGFQNTSRVSHGGTSRGEGRILAASLRNAASDLPSIRSCPR